MKTTWILIGLAALVALGGDVASEPAAKRLQVVTTLSDYADLVRRLGGDRVEVKAIVRGDQDAHFIRPKPSFLAMVQKADMLVATGLDLETWLTTVVDRSGNTRVRSGAIGYVSASHGMPLREKPATMSRVEGGLHIHGNPHVTNSPLMMKIAARNIVTGLTKNDPAGREIFDKNLTAFTSEVDRRLFGEDLVKLLGGKVLTRLGQSGELVPFLEKHEYRGKPLIDRAGGWLGKMRPLHHRALVTYHKNWIYFLRLFSIEEAGTVEPKPGIPPSPRHVADLVKMMKTRRIGVILAANYFDEDKVRATAAQVGATPVIVPLYVGGAKGADDVFALMDLWVDSLVRATRKAEPGD